MAGNLLTEIKGRFLTGSGVLYIRYESLEKIVSRLVFYWVSGIVVSRNDTCWMLEGLSLKTGGWGREAAGAVGVDMDRLYFLKVISKGKCASVVRVQSRVGVNFFKFRIRFKKEGIGFGQWFRTMFSVSKKTNSIERMASILRKR